MSAPSVLIDTLRQAVRDDPNFVLCDIGDNRIDIERNLNNPSAENTPDVLISILASGLYPSTTTQMKRYGTKIILFWDDLHWYQECIHEARHRIFRDSDLLLLPYHHVFLDMEEYTQYHHKSQWFPWFAPNECFEDCPAWSDRSPKILLSGASHKDIYPLRYQIYNFGRQTDNSLHILPHPGYKKSRKHNIFGSAYYTFMKTFQGAVGTTGTPYSVRKPYLICKFFEIAGCGCTPFFEHTEELELLGFVPGIHYVPLDSQNYKTALHLDPTNHECIAQQAQQLVMQKHSALIRAGQTLEKVKAIMQ